MDKNDIKQLLLEMDSARELLEGDEINFEQFGKLVYEYMFEPITYALSGKLSDEKEM